MKIKQEVLPPILPPPSSPARRQLSAQYVDPTGKLTADDPESFLGHEREIREEAVVRDLPRTGYALAIIERQNYFFQPNHALPAPQEEAVRIHAPRS